MSAPDLQDLTPENQLIVAGLLRRLVRLDGQFTAAEQETLQDLALSTGRKRFWSLMEQAGERFSSDESLRQAAMSVKDPEAREHIFGVLVRVAQADSLAEPEAQLLEWLREIWQLPATPVSKAPAQ